MSDKEITWTEEELRDFDGLIDQVSSRNQLERITGRIDMNKFIGKHGKEKCDAMFKHLESGK